MLGFVCWYWLRFLFISQLVDFNKYCFEMKFVFLFSSFFTITSLTAKAQKEEICYNPSLVKDTTKKSIKSIAVGVIDGDTVTVKYHSPGVRKRVIWGGLVPYEEVWVTGAHDATMVEFRRPVRIGNSSIPAGKYAFFSIPGKKHWTLILNKNWEQHLASEYDEQDDVVRIDVRPRKVRHTERLQYFIEESKNKSGKIRVAWEQLEVEVPFILDK